VCVNALEEFIKRTGALDHIRNREPVLSLLLLRERRQL
jgi:hypothetical protein